MRSLLFQKDVVAQADETYLADTPVLKIHAGTQPDLFLRWNHIPQTAAAIDVVVFLHGFSQSGGAMPLSEKIERSGLILGGRRRPTLAARVTPKPAVVDDPAAWPLCQCALCRARIITDRDPLKP